MDANDFVYRRMIHFADTDMAGIAHFSRFFLFMEEAEHAFLKSRGLSVYSNSDGGVLSWPRVSVHCDYHSPARYEDELEIRVVVAEIAPKAITYEFRMTLGVRKVATGRIVAVCCRIVPENGGHRLHSVPVPEEFIQRLTGGRAS
jgi:YbgC/YbaW family acyl-CoA thioester hydrolase